MKRRAPGESHGYEKANRRQAVKFSGCVFVAPMRDARHKDA
ncbi:MAG: hypothetical protein R6X27_13875 [Candidatus Desulfacyla sp.]